MTIADDYWEQQDTFALDRLFEGSESLEHANDVYCYTLYMTLCKLGLERDMGISMFVAHMLDEKSDPENWMPLLVATAQYRAESIKYKAEQAKIDAILNGLT